jgi:serine/threonine-protein kinase RsbT
MAMSAETEGSVRINSEGDLITARTVARTLAIGLGFGITDVTRIVTATSELARNIISYAGSGIMKWKSLDTGTDVGIELVFEDHGPGITNVDLAMQEGFTTSNGLGLGLPGSKRLMGQLEVFSQVGKGTTVIVRKLRKK